MSDEILDVTINRALENIGAASGGRAKRQALKDELGSPHGDLLKQVLRYAYDPAILFGITERNFSTPVTVAPHPTEFDSWVFVLLDQVIAASGTNAKRELLESRMAEMGSLGRQLVTRIINRDLRCGISASTINNACPNLLAKFDVMLAKLYSERSISSWPVLVEPKLDGLRVIADVDTRKRTVTYSTRTGKAITSLNNFSEEVLAFAMSFTETGVVTFDGEVTSGSFLESLSEVRKSDKQVEEGTYNIFDALVLGGGTSPIMGSNEELKVQGTQLERRRRLIAAWEHYRAHVDYVPKFLKPTGSYSVNSEEEIFTLYDRCRDAGYEGVLIKDPDAFYVKKRSSAWMKIKAKETLDLPVVGAFEGAGQFKGSLGGLIVLNGEVEVRVGSGFNVEQRRTYWDAIQTDMQHVNQGSRELCTLIDCPIEVAFQEKLPSGSLRHPVFVRLRRDKAMGAGAF